MRQVSHWRCCESSRIPQPVSSCWVSVQVQSDTLLPCLFSVSTLRRLMLHVCIFDVCRPPSFVRRGQMLSVRGEKVSEALFLDALKKAVSQWPGAQLVDYCCAESGIMGKMQSGALCAPTTDDYWLFSKTIIQPSWSYNVLLHCGCTGDSIGGSDPHYQVFIELKGVRNLTEEQRYKVMWTHVQQVLSSHEFPHYLNVSSPSVPVGHLSPAGLGRLQVVPYQRQHRTDEGAAGGGGGLQRTSQTHDGLFQHLTQHL